MEASRLLRDVRVHLNWVDCTSRVVSATCMTDRLPTDLAVRVLAKALPQVSANALGIAGTNVGEATAFIFYDRMVSLRTQARSLPSIVGRVLAHEITHLLLPAESHSELGLMRAHWTADDMRDVQFRLHRNFGRVGEAHAKRSASQGHQRARGRVKVTGEQIGVTS